MENRGAAPVIPYLIGDVAGGDGRIDGAYCNIHVRGMQFIKLMNGSLFVLHERMRVNIKRYADIGVPQ